MIYLRKTAGSDGLQFAVFFHLPKDDKRAADIFSITDLKRKY